MAYTEFIKQNDSLKKSMAIFLIILCPPSVMLMWYTNSVLGGSFLELGKSIQYGNFYYIMKEVWFPVFFGTRAAWSIIGIFAAVQLIFMRFLPGKTFKGPITPMGNVPVYKENGILSFTLSVTLFLICSYWLKLFSPSIIYNHFGEILGALNFTSLVFCLILYIKGRFFPSSTDSGYSGNFIFDYYWGTELYPRIFGWDVKMFTNCRIALMGWALIVISFAFKQYELYGISSSMAASAALQLFYIAKFFKWETGYLASMDIMHDRAGFYICWGCLVWVPGVYTSQTQYLVNHPNRIPLPVIIVILLLGAVSIMINYLADRQRQVVRKTNGECLIWGKKPLIIHAEYTTVTGDKKNSILLASGWWGLSRHFHYIPEILGAFFWSVPALFVNFLPYFYVTFLTILLAHRAVRDDRRCSEKYGKYWEEYKALVPNRILPRILKFKNNSKLK